MSKTNGNQETAELIYTEIKMSERKFSLKDTEKEELNVQIDDRNLRRMNYRTADNPSIHLALFFCLQVRVFFPEADLFFSF